MIGNAMRDDGLAAPSGRAAVYIAAMRVRDTGFADASPVEGLVELNHAVARGVASPMRPQR